LQLKKGIVIKSTGKEYIIRSGRDFYTCVLRGRMRLKNSRATNPVAVGDHVGFKEDDKGRGIIETVEQRKNHLLRKSTNLSKKSQVIAANIDQAVLIVTLAFPKTTRLFIDRFLVSAQSFGIPVVMIFNKTDLYGEAEMEELEELKNIYTGIVQSIHSISATDSGEKPRLQAILKNKTSVLAGHSGVGKSTLINLADNTLKLKTASISDTHKTGKHTTSYAEMHSLSFGGYVIDTPGIRAFGIVHIEKEELYHFFSEIFQQAQHCKYHNCLHTEEPGCAVKEAVINGDIAESRFLSYLNLLFDDQSKHREADY
jgi:ribosome biogenesis GTPase